MKQVIVQVPDNFESEEVYILNEINKHPKFIKAIVVGEYEDDEDKCDNCIWLNNDSLDDD